MYKRQLGVVLYELLTDTPPFSSQDVMALVYSHLAERPVPPHELVPALPRIVSDLVMRLLEKNAEDRYQYAGGLASDLEECIARLAQSAVTVSYTHLDVYKRQVFGTSTTYGSGADPRAIAAGDVNGDGATDLVTVSFASSNISVYLNKNDGSGTFQNASSSAVGTSPVHLVLADASSNFEMIPNTYLCRWL